MPKNQSPIERRHDFVFLFDIKNGNPNGDPDAGNAPRVDPETGHGLVTDVCLKRKIRNFVTLNMADPDGSPKKGYDIYVKERAVLNLQHKKAYDALGIDPKAKPEKAPKGENTDKPRLSNEDKARNWMCENFFDIRMFGAVMSTEINAGQVRGPVQLTFSRSIDPIVSLEHSVTRMAVTTEKESEAQSGGNRTMGRKTTVPYALYRCHGFISAPLASQTGFHKGDLELLWKSLANMFDHDRSAARGEMAARGLYVFEHGSALGNAPAHKLFDRITVQRADDSKPPRDFSDYKVTVVRDHPQGVKMTEMI